MSMFEEYFKENSSKIKSLETQLEDANRQISELRRKEKTFRKTIEDEMSDRILSFNLKHKKIRLMR